MKANLLAEADGQQKGSGSIPEARSIYILWGTYSLWQSKWNLQKISVVIGGMVH